MAKLRIDTDFKIGDEVYFVNKHNEPCKGVVAVINIRYYGSAYNIEYRLKHQKPLDPAIPQYKLIKTEKEVLELTTPRIIEL